MEHEVHFEYSADDLFDGAITIAFGLFGFSISFLFSGVFVVTSEKSATFAVTIICIQLFNAANNLMLCNYSSSAMSEHSNQKA